MTDKSCIQDEQQPPGPNPDLKSLDRLVGKWKVSDPDIKGSLAYYEGKWSEDGNTNTCAWHYPDGGGYESTMIRVKHEER